MIDEDVNLACFEIKGQLYALEIAQVKEIVRVQEITPLPNAPALIEGVIDLRGIVVPVVDLAKVLGRGTSELGILARIVVLENDGLVFGLCVEAATDVLSLKPGELGDVPDLIYAYENIPVLDSLARMSSVRGTPKPPKERQSELF